MTDTSSDTDTGTRLFGTRGSKHDEDEGETNIKIAGGRFMKKTTTTTLNDTMAWLWNPFGFRSATNVVI